MDLVQTTQQVSLFAALLWSSAVTLLPRLAAAIVVLIVGFFLARVAGDKVRLLVKRSSHIDKTLAPAISSTVRYATLIFVLVAALSEIGIQTTSLLAVLGAAGLAIGLALQGTLSNIAAGVMLLWLRPFREGDSIETASAAGTVREVGLFNTHIDTHDGVYRFIPNSALWNTPVFNYTRNPARMADIPVGIGYGADITAARDILLDLAHSDPSVLAAPPAEVIVDSLGDSAVGLRFRVWLRTAEFGLARPRLMEELKRRFDLAGIEIPFPQRVVHTIAAKAG
jgi:small conductance mechanosensitive channel